MTDARQKIINKLKKVEEECDVKVLYAVESGSRVWGFNNHDSDYDVRFIYKSNNLKDYLRLNPPEDVIRFTRVDWDTFDFEGWDIRKMLKLHYKNNPSLYEWSKNLNTYIGAENYKELFFDLPSFDKVGLQHHYKSMALTTYNKHVAEKSADDLKVLKKLLQVIRCILCFKVLFTFDEYPELNFNALMEQAEVDDEYKFMFSEMQRLYVNKKDLSQTEDAQLFPLINTWIGCELRDLQKTYPNGSKTYKDLEVYDQKFYDIVVDGVLD